jgi:hypothetical protein
MKSSALRSDMSRTLPEGVKTLKRVAFGAKRLCHLAPAVRRRVEKWPEPGGRFVVARAPLGRL